MQIKCQKPLKTLTNHSIHEINTKEWVECTIHLSIYTSALNLYRLMQPDQAAFPRLASSPVECLSLSVTTQSGNVYSNGWLRVADVVM